MVQVSPSVVSAARILKFLTRYKTARAGLTDIAVGLGLAKSSTSRILKALVDEHLVDYDPLTRLYSLGPYSVVIGSRAEENVDYLASIRTALQELAKRTGQTTAWIQRVETERLMYVAKHEGTADPSVSLSIGNRFPITEVSFGQWVVAYADDGERAMLLSHGLPRMSDRNITDAAEYITHCDTLRERGYVTTDGDYMPGIWAASSPVLVSPGAELLGIIAIVGLADVLAEEQRQAAVSALLEVCGRLVASERGSVVVPSFGGSSEAVSGSRGEPA